MKHETEIVEYKQLSDGQFAVLVRCCGDEQHDSWHTVGPEVVVDAEKLTESIAAHRERVANNHEAAIKAEEMLKSLVGKRQSHL